MIAMHSVHASSSQLLKSFEVDSIHMPLSSQVKSSRMWSSRRWSTLGHFSLKSGHVSVPQRLAGLHVVGCCERFYKMSHVRSWLLCLWRRKKSTGVGVAFLERRTNCSLHATVCVEAYWFWVQKDRSMLGLSLGLCSRRRFESSESVHCIPNPWVKKTWSLHCLHCTLLWFRNTRCHSSGQLRAGTTGGCECEAAVHSEHRFIGSGTEDTYLRSQIG